LRDIAGTQSRKALWIGLSMVALLVILFVTGCSGIEPYEARDNREEGLEQGLISGPDGEFVIYRKVDEPDTSSEVGKGSDDAMND